MKHKTLPRPLKISIAVILCLTVFVFSSLGMSIHTMSENTIEDIGMDYMEGMNQQVSLHFKTIIELRLTMAESIAHIAQGDEASGYGSKEAIEYGARARHFLCAALYSADGSLEPIYGDSVSLNHPAAFLESMRKGERRAASAVDSSGEGVILFGVPCKYPMSDGRESMAMVVGLSTKYMGEVLFLDSDHSLMYSFVIRKDGSYVVGNEGDVYHNYFDRLNSILGSQDQEAADAIAQMSSAMEAGTDYSVILKNGGSRHHLYCTSLPYCDWYLVTVLPFEGLDQAISGMSGRWLTMVYAGSFEIGRAHV